MIVIDPVPDCDATAVATTPKRTAENQKATAVATPTRAHDAPITPKRTAENHRAAPRTKEVAAPDAQLVC